MARDDSPRRTWRGGAATQRPADGETGRRGDTETGFGYRGSGFGPAGEGFVRFSAFGHRADVEEACRRLVERLR